MTQDVLVQNTGEQPLTITGITIGADALDAPDGVGLLDREPELHGRRAAGRALATETDLGHRPRHLHGEGRLQAARAGATSVARLQFTSNSDDATERVLLVGSSLPGSISQEVPVGGSVGGSVAGQLALTIPAGPWSFGTFVPGVARDYDMNLAAQVTSTAGNALLTVTDPSSTATGHLVNGTYALASPLRCGRRRRRRRRRPTHRSQHGGYPAHAQELHRAGHQRRGADRAAAVHRRDRGAAGRRLRQEPDVHAVLVDAVS